MPEEPQDRMIEYIRDDTWSVRHTASSHSPFLSRVGSAGRVEFLVTTTANSMEDSLMTSV